jgi:Protein of unknown function (DUF3168)
MSIADAIYYETANSEGISALVGSQVYLAGDVPQGTSLPFLVLQRIDSNQDDHQGGDGCVDSRYQFTAYGSTLASARAVGAAVITEFKHFRGAMGEAGSTVNIRDMQIENDADLPSPPSDSSERGPQGYVVDTIIFYAL